MCTAALNHPKAAGNQGSCQEWQDNFDTHWWYLHHYPALHHKRCLFPPAFHVPTVLGGQLSFRGTKSQGSSSHSMSSPSPTPAPAAWCVQGWNTCCSSAVEWILKMIFLYAAPILRKLLSSLQKSGLLQNCWQSLGLIFLEQYTEIQEIKSKNHMWFLERSFTIAIKF